MQNTRVIETQLQIVRNVTLTKKKKVLPERKWIHPNTFCAC